ncbi:hypothetical protein [Agromyces sp. NPDC056965]|uniref:hypothetical protein n=1 Tax=Agromyces sp. NPDC056965 TaxID=3345983 RepID=UPI003642AF60
MSASEPRSLLSMCRAYAARMRPSEVFSHGTAAELHGLPIPHRLRGQVHVAAISPAGLPRAAGVHGHLVLAGDVSVTRRFGLSVVDPVDAWCQLADSLTERELVVIGDALLRRRRPLATPEGLQAAVRRRAGRRGRRKLIGALARIRPRTDSPAETELRLDLVDFGLPEPEVNVEITDADGRLIAIADLAYPAYRVAAEYDGEQHRTDRDQYARDVDRLDDVAHEGWRLVRFNVRHRGILRRQRIARLRDALIAAGWRPGTVR